MNNAVTPPLRLGVLGLGRAFTLMLPTFVSDPRVELVAATDPIAAACRQFERDFKAPTYASVPALCADPTVQAIYVASPHQFHADHVCLAAQHGKHVLVEKPMALSLDECTRMIEAARHAGVQLIVGHSHSFNTPIRRTRELIASGAYGRVQMITALNFTDFLYRPRRPEELDSALGGGVTHSQAAHQIDIIRLLGGGRVTSVFAHTGAWDRARPTEGAYSALLRFADGAFASASYSGYGHFDSDLWMDNVGELGQIKNTRSHGMARTRLRGVADSGQEADLKAARNYGGTDYQPPASNAAPAHQHFGPLIVSCERADLRPGPLGIAIDSDSEHSHEALTAPGCPRAEVIDEMVASVLHGVAPLHSGEWARATTAVCLAMLESAATGRAVVPPFQVGCGDAP